MPDKKPEQIPPIMVAEDDKPTRELLGAIISRKYPGATLYFADNGKTGVEIFKKHLPDIVITDIKMPVMDGIEMASQIKLMKPETKIIVVTAFGNKVYLSRFSEIGYNAYITKPVEFAKLFEAIQKCAAEVTSH